MFPYSRSVNEVTLASTKNLGISLHKYKSIYVEQSKKQRTVECLAKLEDIFLGRLLRYSQWHLSLSALRKEKEKWNSRSFHLAHNLDMA